MVLAPTEKKKTAKHCTDWQKIGGRHQELIHNSPLYENIIVLNEVEKLLANPTVSINLDE